MSLPLHRISEILNHLAPRHLAQAQDNTGLQIGDLAARINRILVALDPAIEVVDEAIRLQAGLIITHHPLFYQPVSRINYENAQGQLLERIIGHRLNIISAHTNWDAAGQGANQYIADILGLADSRPLDYQLTPGEKKLVTFVPPSHVQTVFSAMMQAGAGIIGNYSHCSFWLDGTGTFQGEAGAHPAIGRAGQLERVREVRIEARVSESRLPHVIQAMLQAHPYEEAAYDVYPLAQYSPGLGRVGNIRECSLEDLCGQLCQQMQLTGLRWTGRPAQQLTRVAVCTGSGGSMLEAASASGAQALITGDISYHQAQRALSLGLCLIDIGHFAPEKLSMSHLAKLLQEKLSETGETVEVLEAKTEADPFRFYIC